MRFFLVFLTFVSVSVHSSSLESEYIRSNTALHAELLVLKGEVELLKSTRSNIIVSSKTDVNLETKIIELDFWLKNHESLLENSTTKTELTIFKDNLLSRIDSSDESISNWGIIFGILGTGWGVLITLVTLYISYQNNKKADEVVKDCTERMDHWIENSAPKLLQEKTAKYIEEIASMRDQAERFLLFNQQNSNRNSTVENELHLDNELTEPVSDRVKSVIELYSSKDFAEAILKAKFILNGTVNNRDRIELLQIISNSYNAIARPDLADDYNAELLRVINHTSFNISQLGRANILFKIAMNKYSLNNKSDSKGILVYLNDIISEFLGSKDIELIRIVAKSRMFKAIINENDDYYASAEEQYKEIIVAYKDFADKELKEVVEYCQSNLTDLRNKDA